MQRRIVPSMQIRVHLRLTLTRYKGCNNGRCILSRSYGYEEFKNVNLFSVQKAHKAVGADQYRRSHAVPHSTFNGNSRTFATNPSSVQRFTNARCILSRSYGHEEFINVNPFTVQKAHKSVRAGQYLRPMQRLVVPSMEIRVNSRLTLTRYKGCTNARCILSRSYGHEEFKNVNLFSVQMAHKAVGPDQYLRSHAAPYSSFNGNSRTFATNPSSVQRLH